jgi:hypothetical protein
MATKDKGKTLHVHAIYASSLDIEFPVWGKDFSDRVISLRSAEKFTSESSERTWDLVKDAAISAMSNTKMVSPLKGDRIMAVRYSYTKTGQKFMRMWEWRQLVESGS